MIRRTLSQTRDATFAVMLPEPRMQGMPWPTGSGFFVSSDGWFLTAAHVVMDRQSNQVRSNIGEICLEQEARWRGGRTGGDFFEALSTGAYGSALCQHLELRHVDPVCDVAFLKADFEKNKAKTWLTGRTGFPFLSVSTRLLEEAEPTYAFGYPLSSAGLVADTPTMKMGSVALRPRVTSAIVSSVLEQTTMVSDPLAPPTTYVLDKALNYGNSGGPIVSVATGSVHALCSRFQPLVVRQKQKDNNGNPIDVMMPSLYGIVVNLSQPQLMEKFEEYGIPVATA